MTSSTAMPVITRRTPGEDVAARAHAVLHAALAVAELWNQKPAVVRSASRLARGLDEHAALTTGLIHWEQLYPHLSAAEDPHAEALVMAACEAEDRARALITTIAATCGTEVADGIKAVAGEAS